MTTFDVENNPAIGTQLLEPAGTGVTRHDLEGMSYDERAQLARWTRANSGGDNGEFIPAAIRRLPIETRLAFAYSDDLTAYWHRREVLRVRDGFGTMSGARYFVEQYGHVQPPTGGAVPFYLWSSQRWALAMIEQHQRTIAAKARRLGLSWLALHYADWLLEHNPATPAARVLLLAKNQGDASKLLQRVKRVHDLQPAWLRVGTEQGQDDSKTSWSVRDGSISCLPATEGAARQETVTYFILDEFAFVRNMGAAHIWTAVQPTIEGGGKLTVISTGNGRAGDGATFANVYLEAAAGRSEAKALFLPWHARPGRTKEWHERERTNYESDAAFEAEYPGTPEQALAGSGTVNVYPIEGINAAERLGALLWDSDMRSALIEDGIEWGTDWGDFQTFTVYAVGLPGGGLFIFDELLQGHVEPTESSARIIAHDPGGVRAPDGGKAVVTLSHTDSAPAGTNATFVKVLDDAHARGYVTLSQGATDERIAVESHALPEQNVRVQFGVYKDGGGDKRNGVSTVNYYRHLFGRSARWSARAGTISDVHACVAIHPRCVVLLAQLRALERDPETGKVRKPSIDPKHPERGDHGPDACIPLAAERAVEWHALQRASEE